MPGFFFSGQLIQRGLVVVDAGTSKKEVPRLYRIAPYHWRLGIGTDDSSDRGWFERHAQQTTKTMELDWHGGRGIGVLRNVGRAGYYSLIFFYHESL